MGGRVCEFLGGSGRVLRASGSFGILLSIYKSIYVSTLFYSISPTGYLPRLLVLQGRKKEKKG